MNDGREKRSAAEIDVLYVARLARISLTEAEVRCFQPQLEQIVHYMNKLSELNLDDVEPTVHVRPVRNVMRDDEVRAGMDPEAAMANAPEQVNGHFKVPQIVE